VAHGGALGVVAAPLADDLGGLLLHQLGQNAQADAHREGKKPLLGDTHQLPERLLHAWGSGCSWFVTACSAGTFSFTVVLLRSWRITPKAPSESGRSGRTAVLKFYGLRDNLIASPTPAWRGPTRPSA
jgi:hypothetical protein